MTGRDLIVYILQNNLENEVVVKDGVFLCFMNEKEAAIKFGVGVATVRAWYMTGMIDGVVMNGSIYFLRNIEDPRKRKEVE